MNKLWKVTIYSDKKENYSQNVKTIIWLENFLNYLYNSKNFISDKKNVKRVGLKLNSFDKTTYEKVVDYFINKIIDEEAVWKQVNFNPDFLEKKFFNSLNKKESKDFDEIENNVKEKVDFVEKVNNKFILNYIKDSEAVTSDCFNKFLTISKDIENLKLEHKQQVLALKDSVKDKVEYKKQYSTVFKDYQKSLNKLNMQVKRLWLAKKYKFLINEINE